MDTVGWLATVRLRQQLRPACHPVRAVCHATDNVNLSTISTDGPPKTQGYGGRNGFIGITAKMHLRSTHIGTTSRQQCGNNPA